MKIENVSKLLKMLPFNYFSKDINSVYTECNESTAEYAGLDSPTQIVGKTEYDLIWRNSSAESFIKTDKEVIAGKPQINHLESIQVSTGMKDFLITKTSLLDENDKVIGIVGCNICVSGFTLTKQEGFFNLEEQRLNLGEAFGYKSLTPRQLQVFKCILNALPDQKIASVLGLKLKYVRSIIEDLKIKLNCHSKMEIVLEAIKNGWTFLLNENRILPLNL